MTSRVWAEKWHITLVFQISPVLNQIRLKCWIIFMSNLRMFRQLDKKWEQKWTPFNAIWQPDNVVAGKNLPYMDCCVANNVMLCIIYLDDATSILTLVMQLGHKLGWWKVRLVIDWYDTTLTCTWLGWCNFILNLNRMMQLKLVLD